MRNETKPKKDCTFRLTPSVSWRIRNIELLEHRCISVEFMDGLKGIADLSGLISEKNPGVFITLRDANIFKQAYLDRGAITWPGNLDLAPDAMYESIRKTGKYIL